MGPGDSTAGGRGGNELVRPRRRCRRSGQPFGNIGESGLAFINADLSVYVGRLPVGKWIGLEIAARSASGTVATVGANLYDCQGAFGTGSVASVATGSIGVPTQVAT